MKTAKPDVLPGMPSVLMVSHFSLFSLSIVFPVSKMGSQNKNLDGLSMLIKDKKEQPALLRKQQNLIWLHAQRKWLAANAFKTLTCEKTRGKSQPL